MGQLGDTIREVLQLDSSAPAIEFRGQSISWGELRCAVEKLEADFDRLALPTGAQIGCVLRNSPHHLALLLAAVLTDRCIVTLNPFQPDDKLATDVARLKPPVVVAAAADWERGDLCDAVADLGSAGIELTSSWDASVRSVDRLATITGQDLCPPAPGTAIMMLTSGTTGPPKRIPLKSAGLERAILDALRYERDRDPGDPPKLSDVTLIQFTSFVHIGGIFNALRAVFCGRRLYLLEKFAVDEWAAAVERFRPAVATLPPAALRMVLDADIDPERLSSLRAVRSSTAPLNQTDADEFKRRFDAPVLQNYGATEFAGGVAGWTLRDHYKHDAEKRGAVGRMHEDIEARVRDPQTDEVLAPGQEGILELRGPQFANAREWIRTTDLAVLDEDGFLWIKGRSDNAIIRGGFKIHPDEVVAVLEGHPDVREAVVVGVADARLGAVPVAVVILKGKSRTLTEDDLRAWARSKLIPYQVPVAFHFVADLPRTAALKPNLPAIRENIEKLGTLA